VGPQKKRSKLRGGGPKTGSEKGQKYPFFDQNVQYLAAYCSEGAESGVIRRFDPGLGRFPTISEGVDYRRVDKMGVQVPKWLFMSSILGLNPLWGHFGPIF